MTLIIDFDSFESAENEEEINFKDLEVEIDLEDEKGNDLDSKETSESTRTIRIRMTKKMQKANTVKAAVSRKLLGEDSPIKNQIEKIFKVFKREIRKEAASQGVPLNTINLDKISIRKK